MTNLKIEKLNQEGKLQKGDLISTDQHGKCEVEWIDSIGSIVIKQLYGTGKLIRLSGIDFGDASVMSAI